MLVVEEVHAQHPCRLPVHLQVILDVLDLTITPKIFKHAVDVDAGHVLEPRRQLDREAPGAAEAIHDVGVRAALLELVTDVGAHVLR